MYNKQDKSKAAALGYTPKIHEPPKILALGSNYIAEKIIKLAKEERIPIVKNIPLVEILSELEVNAFIPKEVYKIVAEILHSIYISKNNKKHPL